MGLDGRADIAISEEILQETLGIMRRLVSVDPEVRHGEPVFAGTRMPLEGAVESVLAY
jgi:uncharacterized protein (DUF433 family)